MKTIGRILLTLLVIFSSSALARTDQGAFENAADRIEVVDSSISYSRGEGNRNIITTIGKLRNNSAVGVENITIEVKYYDSQKSLIDTVTQNLYPIVIPPSKEVSFRVRDEADKPKELYVSHDVRIVAAEQMEPRRDNKKKSPSTLVNLLISWGPMLLLIGVWIYFMRRTRNNPPQKKTIELLEHQNELFVRQIETLEKLALAVEKNGKRPADGSCSR